MTTDKGLKKAVNGQPAYRLPSNFTYHMMKQIHEEARARERRAERRSTLMLTAFCLVMLGAVAYYIIKVYGNVFTNTWHIMQHSLPADGTFRFMLPILVSAVCLGFLYGWLEKKTRALLE